MAAGQERALRRRIKSVNSTRKITRAMELIAASRIARAQQAIAAARPYVEGMKDLLAGLAGNTEARRHPIFAEVTEVHSAVVVAVAADRGLCGAYNTNVLRAAEKLVVTHTEQERSCRLILVGKKAHGYFRYRGYDTEDSFVGVTDKPQFADAARIAALLGEVIASGQADLVQLVYTRFRSLGTQEVVTEQVFPVEPVDSVEVETPALRADYEFEPDAAILLDSLVPRVVESRVYGALLDASASEHASRQRAMKAATDNADEFARNLTRQMNRARQDSITTEISEIVGGAEALSQGVQ